MIVRNSKDLDGLRNAGRLAALVLKELGEALEPGITTEAIDTLARKKITNYGGKSAFLGYKGYPGVICISVNEEVVHGIGGKRRLKVGDIVSIDVGVMYDGYIGDTAATFIVGSCTPAVRKLVEITKEALYEGIAQAKTGNYVEDISRAIQECVERAGFSVVKEFVGHGVGKKVHEEPQIPNYVTGAPTPRLVEGLVLAIEPMVNMGTPDVKILEDGWTVVTADGKPSAHFEHTIIVGKEPEILTRCVNLDLCRQKLK